MALDPADLAYVRSYVGWDPPSDAELEARWEALLADLRRPLDYVVPADPLAETRQIRAAVAASFVRARLADMLDNPSSFTTDEYSESWSQNMITLREQITALEAQAGGLSAAGAGSWGRLVRPDAQRGPCPDPIDPYRGIRAGY